MRNAIYAGTFDPPTFGHIDVIQRGARIFDRLTVAVAASSSKQALFSVEERVGMLRDIVADIEAVEVDAFDGLLVDYARSREIHVIIRGLRAISDFEFEFQMALTNRKMAPDVETLFLMPKEEYSYVSSSVIKEIAQMGGALGHFVPTAVERALNTQYGRAS